jgi:hypothetical protein
MFPKRKGIVVACMCKCHELVELVELVAKNHLKISGPSRAMDYKANSPGFFVLVVFV